ncbi:MAG TPA: hypothetical protein VM733_01230, partial [Thermoanaerobaculia bacterium]|nr:hypothetical protein [Thermoanaerobaculia bacterium]
MNERGKIVPMGARRRAPSAQHVAEFAEIARRMREERDTAANVVERLLRETPRERWRDLAEREELQTCGALEKLGNRVAQILKSDPRQALEIARLAVAVTEQLAPDAYHPVVLTQLRVHASKDVGQALAYLGRYDEALAALDRAESEAAAWGTLAHDHAIVRFVRATTLQDIDRH